MIPDFIKRSHILQAISHLRKIDVPARRCAKKFVLLHNGSQYPAKYVLAIAHEMATGRELDPETFSGGDETNRFLRNLGFDIVRIHAEATSSATLNADTPAKAHPASCKKCKAALIRTIKAMFGDVRQNWLSDTPVRLEDYTGTPQGKPLASIHAALAGLRGHQDFIRRRLLPPCDLLIPALNCLVEFDENQHFTHARKIALSLYPDTLSLGFPRKRWQTLCAQIDAHDSTPPYRGEQRAWYDTLRDFLPRMQKMNPTVRIHMGEFAWCKASSEEIRARLREIIPSAKSKDQRSSTRSNASVTIATAIPEVEDYLSRNDALAVLKNILSSIEPQPDILLLPGGFFYNADKPTSDTLQAISSQIQKVMPTSGKDTIVVTGLDCRESKDQLALAISRKGVIAAGRKFYPTPKDIASGILAAESRRALELGYSRMFTHKGHSFFLAVCYDLFGIKRGKDKSGIVEKRDEMNPGVHAVLGCIHRFCRKGKGPSGETNFARHGIAGASKAWGCPVFATAHFVKRLIPKSWPSGVFWRLGKKSTTEWTFKANGISPIKTSELLLKGRCSVRIQHFELA